VKREKRLGLLGMALRALGVGEVSWGPGSRAVPEAVLHDVRGLTHAGT